MFIKRFCKLGLMLILMFLFVFIPTNYTKAETINGHKVYTKKLIEKKIDERELIKKRIDEIRYYYYKQPKKLTKKKAVFYRSYTKEYIKFDYYLKGNDLLFAFGTSKGTEYRLYFYKNQLITMYIDENGTRYTYEQLYEPSPYEEYLEFNGNLCDYLEFEKFFKIQYASLYKKTKIRNMKKSVFITNVSNTNLTFQTGETTGPNGSLWLLETKPYFAKLGKNVKVIDNSTSPYKSKKRNINWIRSNLIPGSCWYAYVIIKNGKVVEIEIPYMA